MRNNSETKQRLRLQMIQQRLTHAKQYPLRTPFLIQNIIDAIQKNFSNNSIIAGVWPLENEPDLRPLLYQLHEKGYKISLPETTPKGMPLIFRKWHPEVVMEEGRYKTFHPQSDQVIPNVILVPLLAFDRQGNRLGYGGGYYDRTLCLLSHSVAIGFAFADQEVTVVPTDDYDCVLSSIITDQEIIQIKRG